MTSIWLKILRFYGLHMPIARGKGVLTKFAFRHLSVPEEPLKTDIAPNIEAELNPWLWSDFCTYAIGSPEPYAISYFRSIIQPDSIIFDIGAYIGIYSFTACALLKTGQVHTFEPNPKSAKRLRKTIKHNSLSQIFFNNVAVGNRSGMVNFQTHENPVQSSIQTNNSNANSIDIPIIRLDEYCKTQSVDHINIIKIDVEGAELQVLQGGENIIQQSRPLMIIELHKNESVAFGYTIHETLQYLKDIGYGVYVLKYGITTQPKLTNLTNLDLNRHIVVAIPSD